MNQVTGAVIAGEKIGRKIGFPTANLLLAKKPKIKCGVYAVLISLKQQNYLGLAYFSPLKTFEVYIFNFNQLIYGQTLTVKLLKFLRKPKTINNLPDLKKLLEADVAKLNDFVILINKNDQILGIEEKIKAHLGKGKLHRAISVQLFNHQGELLIQQRAKTKKLFAGIWANTVCTDVRPNETYLLAANRRLKEEFGLKSELKPAFKFIYSARWNKAKSEREVDQVFLGLVNGRPNPNPQEIGDWQFISLKKAREKLKDFAPWFKLILKKIKPSDIVVS